MAIGTPVGGTNLVNTSATTTYDVPYPASPAATDMFALRLSLNTTSAITDPSGWTLVGSPSASGTTTPRCWVYIKAATGTESGNLSVTTPSTTGQARMYKIPGVNQSTPQDTTATTASLAATTAYDLPSLTTVTAGALLFGFVAANTTGAGTFTPPTIQGGFTEILDVNTVMHSSDAYVLMGAAGASGIANFVRSGSVRGAGVLLALRPAILPIFVQPPRRP